MIIPNHLSPAVIQMLWYKFGSADEGIGKSGIAHFLEHLMFKGTNKIRSGEFSEIVAKRGGRDNAFTSYDYTGYFQIVSKDQLETVMELEADRMLNLKLNEEDISVEREVILQERRETVEDKPQRILGEMMMAMLYNGHPYSVPIIGFNHEMRSLSKEDAFYYYKKYYAPNNAVLLISGDVTIEEVKDLAKKHFGSIPKRTVPERKRSPVKENRKSQSVTYETQNAKAYVWQRFYLAPSYNSGEIKNTYPLLLLSEILGSGSTSYLYNLLVVQKKIATSIGVYYDVDNLDLGRLVIYAVPAPGVAVEKIELSIEEALSSLIKGNWSDLAERFQEAKSKLITEQVYNRDSLYYPARVFGTALATNQRVSDVEKWSERLDSVSLQNVLDAAKFIFDQIYITGTLIPERDKI
ncbi:MAG: pitrilysin family protein [Pseudomonadota bacterium]|nr:pitrilysin family protein [Pseudomonadota bacterium]